MGRRRRRKNCHGEALPIFLLALGLGILLARIISPGLLLFVFAVALIYVGATIYYC